MLQSILSLMLTICHESPLRPGLAPPSLGLGVGEGSSASLGSGSGDGEPAWPSGDSASPTPGDVSQDQSVCLWQRVPGCPRPASHHLGREPGNPGLGRVTTAGVLLSLPSLPQRPFPQGAASWEEGWALPPSSKAAAGNPALVPGHHTPAWKGP